MGKKRFHSSKALIFCVNKSFAFRFTSCDYHCYILLPHCQLSCTLRSHYADKFFFFLSAMACNFSDFCDQEYAEYINELTFYETDSSPDFFLSFNHR